MAGVQLGPFTAGVNNVAPDTNPPMNEDGGIVALRAAVNVDLDKAGNARRRRGYELQVPGVTHSLFAAGNELLAVVDGDMVACRDDGAGLGVVATLHAGIGDRFVTYATDDFDTWWSNGVVQGRIDADLGLHPFWVATPDPVMAAAVATGGLAAGQYEVSVTATDAEGRESGASGPVMVRLTSGQGIAVTLPARPVGSVQWRVYVSAPDGEVLYLATTLPAAATSSTIGTHTPGKALETAWLTPLPPCQTLRYGHGRLLGLVANALVWSESYRLGLMHDQNHLVLGRQATLLEPVGEGGDGAGWFVADHKRTYFMSGADPASWQQIVRYGSPAVPGTSLTLPGDVFGLESSAPVAFWLAANGVFCLGLPGGAVQPLRSGQLALPIDSERGAAGYFEFDGIHQILTTFLAGADNPLGVGDSADAEIRRNGITL